MAGDATARTPRTAAPGKAKARAASPAPAAVLICAPGLARRANTLAERVADVVAATLDRSRPGRYVAETTSETAPRGLRAAKTVVGPDGTPLLEVFELAYRDRVAEHPDDAGTAPIGALRAAGFAARALWLQVRAFKRRAKDGRAKWQLGLGFGGVLAMAVAAALGVLVALRVVPAPWLGGTGERDGAAVGAGVTVVAAWAWLRPRLLSNATFLRESIRYVEDERHRGTVTQTLDDAIDGLLDAGWGGRPIHLFGYSFGSLVLLDALMPCVVAPDDRVGGAVTTLTTVGCQADLIRLYYLKYYDGRTARAPRIPWTNVYIEADAFASDFRNTDGTSFHIASQRPTANHRYTSATLSLWNFVRFRGLRMHGGYWGTPTEASCFGLLVPAWVPTAPPDSAAGGGRRA